MATDNDPVSAALNELIETCKDGESGFHTAAEGVKNRELKQLFESYSNQRALFAAELQAEVARRGGNPEERGSVAATLLRGWMNIKSLVTGRDEKAILAECERGEDAALKAYEAAQEADLPAELRSVLNRQLTQIHEAHDRIRALEDVSAAT